MKVRLIHPENKTEYASITTIPFLNFNEFGDPKELIFGFNNGETLKGELTPSLLAHIKAYKDEDWVFPQPDLKINHTAEDFHISLADIYTFLESQGVYKRFEYNLKQSFADKLMEAFSESLTFDALRQANIARLPRFKDAQGRIVHRGSPPGSDWPLSRWMNALTGEVGEAANIIKKMERGDFILSDWHNALKQLADELADVQIYLDLLAHVAKIDLAEATISKFNATSDKLQTGVYIYDNRVKDLNKINE